MEFRLNKEVFYKALSIVNKAVSSNTTITVLTGIKLEVTNEKIIVTGANSDMFLTNTIPITTGNKHRHVVDIINTGTVVLPAKIVVAIIKKCENEVHMKLQGNQVSIMSGSIQTTINGLIADEFPQLPQRGSVEPITISSNELKKAILQTAFAVSINETKPVLTGINILLENKKLKLIATNSYRLATKEIDIESSNHQESFIVPTVGITYFVNTLPSDSAHNTSIYVYNNHAIFKYKNVSLYTKLINGTYPNVQSLLNRDANLVISMSKDSLIKGIDRACVFATEWENNNVNLQILDKCIDISSNSTEYGTIQERQEIEVVKGKSNINLTFDGKYMLEALKKIEEDRVMLNFGQSMSPVFIRPTNNSSLRYLISPVRTK
ncbi:DNA polymerase III subunit beta [Oceanobacillus kimchii]|uniref:DNA polymerase III subunit beta n=1 Tax=Oceanobacillus kimchii TaxID=746691 RepID=UPI0021A5F428|nr:DNA polymerase III subunit beta [Oceanobacillus kimchii]MCT1577733.1 DNA polymerase III subunit beta [Oceanobacillus kimchii]MCT2136721.1 DNA polymerase III subunit beta [Oceanobacillus kimchii]